MEAISIAGFFCMMLLVAGSLVLFGCERSSPFGKPEQPARSAVEITRLPT